ncbi:MAG TPA: Asp-tRNA(Asn)/Glu-tRNA(Gln) amidotransferase subunit GatB [Candidatus Saccharimonadales bacterium]|nr:Asp-tRNA(Asn)/Glu-tRNA(Gln) amidotransferase subunit GatB [Candidatus Saccharimonadales bacterium]
MISKETRVAYTATIGIECHVQFKTATKLFAAVGNDARDAEPNTLVSHICFGMPGALPVLNREAIHLGMRAAFALGTEPQKFSKFDRKHYFYPDLPTGYQITQYDEPIILGGKVIIEVAGKKKIIHLTRAHIEADAGKSTHPAGKDYSLVDLNRAGTPLLEIVSEPEMHTAAEAKAYAQELWLLMRYADVSDANLYYGNMRFDVNVSVSKDHQKLGTRSETKNLNSFRSVEKAVEYEINRQIELLEKGEKVAQETRGWDDAKQKTVSQRTKEDAHDYRYFPDPDLPPVVLDDELIETVRGEMPAMPGEWRERLSSLGLDRAAIDTLLVAEVEDEKVAYLPLVENALAERDFAKALANWLINIEIPLRREGTAVTKTDQASRLALYHALHALVSGGKLNSSNAKALITKILQSDEPVKDIEAYATKHGLIQESDEGMLEKIADQVIAENPKAAEDVRNGEMKAIGFLVGQVMKHTQGRANPGLVRQLLKKKLS